MGTQCTDTIRLYASQQEVVWQAIQRDGAAYSRAEYIRAKYGAAAPVFLTAYSWFVKQAVNYVPKPEQAEFPYWAFADQYLMETGRSSRILTLEVPRSEGIFFDMHDWNKIVQLNYIGQTEEEERRFRQELSARGITTRDVMLTGFYPDLKQVILDSWQRLFRHHEAVCRGDLSGIVQLQAGLWCLKRDWILRVDGNPPTAERRSL